MAFGAKAWTATILALVILSLTLAPSWSMAFLILFGMIGLAVEAAKERRNPESSSTSSSSSRFKYEVFLSSRGPNIRNRFADYLYVRLVDAGITVFGDHEDLHAEEEIKPELKEAIKQSRILIAILSKDYASSKSCLYKMVQMWECRKSNGQTIIPIFYDIIPSDVKGQAGDFERYFNQHEIDGVDSNTIETWKEVLRQVGESKGFHLKSINERHEHLLIHEVAARVLQELKKDDQIVTEALVGIDHHVQKVMRKLGVVYSDGQAVKVPDKDVRVVGICGMLGVGKTTLAKVVFNEMRMWFDACSFLQGISSERLQLLQGMLISDLLEKETAPLKSSDEGIEKMASLFGNRRVLIVLDDVHEDEQMKALAGNLSWFGPGSRIIVTTEKRNVLNAFNVGAVEEYKMEPMRHDHGLQLFRKHVFLGDASQDVSEYDSLSIDIVRAVGGLPLAIVHHASYLRRNMNIDTWRSTLEFLKRHPEDRV